MQECGGALALTVSGRIMAPAARPYEVPAVNPPLPLLIGTTTTSATTRRMARRRVEALKAICLA